MTDDAACKGCFRRYPKASMRCNSSSKSRLKYTCASCSNLIIKKLEKGEALRLRIGKHCQQLYASGHVPPGIPSD